MYQKSKKIVVLGGGSAGWMTALYFNKTFPNLQVTVIEDPNQPPIIAGESGSTVFTSFLEYLGINLDNWIVAVNAMPKLGSEFYDWDEVGTKFTHGMVNLNYNQEWLSRHKGVRSARDFSDHTSKDFILAAIAEEVPLETLFFCSGLIHNNRLPITPMVNEYLPHVPAGNETQYSQFVNFMWHFDSRANADYLKSMGLKKGITLIEGKYLDSVQTKSGNIDCLILDNNRTIKGDFFFDCSGFARLLTQKKLGVKFDDFTDIFPARSVVAWWDNEPEIINHTRVYAMEYGWSWNINLHHRAGNGYIYDPDLISSDTALNEAEKRFNKKIDPVASVKFTPSIVKKCWHKNVIAIGISSGFLEPLEANGLGSVIVGIGLVDRLWSLDATPWEIEIFNDEFYSFQLETMDFLSLHYRGHRRDTEFWRGHAYEKKRTTSRLKNMIAAWSHGSVPNDSKNLNIYGYESYIQVLAGLNLINKDKLKEKLLTKNPKLILEFYESYYKLNSTVHRIIQSGLDTKTWEKIVYGSNN